MDCDQAKYDGFSILALADFLNFARQHGVYEDLCQRLEVDSDYFEQNKRTWRDIDFLEKFYQGLYDVYRAKNSGDPMCSSQSHFLSVINRKIIEKKRQPFFRFAISTFVAPKIVWKRLPFLVASTIRYCEVEYEHVQDSLLYSTGRVRQSYKDSERVKTNLLLSDMCYESIKGLADALGTTLVYIKRTKSIDDGDEYCEFEFRWIRKANIQVLGVGVLCFLISASISFFFIPGGESLHGFFYPLLGSLIAMMFVRESSSFDRTDEAFQQQREILSELVERSSAQHRLDTELLKTKSDLESSVKLAAAGELSYSYLHDMESSISVIVMSTEILNECIESEKIDQFNSARHVRTVGAAAAQLTKMQNLIRKISVGGDVGDKVSQNLNESIISAIEVIEPIADKRKIKISVSIQESEQVLILANEGVLESVMLNILNNAIQAMSKSKDRKIEITSSLVGDSVGVEIWDSGPGIVQDKLVRMNQPFKFSSVARCDNGITSSGFGLYKISQSIESLGGDFKIDSSELGTCFKIRIRCYKCQSLVV